MKRRLIAISIFILLTSFSVASAVTVREISTENKDTKTKDFSADPDDAPKWAVGNFSGVWGFNVWGKDWIEIGPVCGYYGKGFLYQYKFGRFLIEYKEKEEENSTKFEGLFIGPYLLGRITNQNTENTSAFVGLGGYNETHFRWRIMGMKGPTLFMKGTFNEF